MNERIYSMKYFILLLLFSMLLIPGVLAGQCILANPSFELAGSGGNVFAGWNQVGNAGSTDEAVHGSKAAKLTGQNNGGWDISVFWQNLDCDPGEQWEISGYVKHSSAAPLTGGCTALINVEWRDGSDGLIAYESFTVANQESATDVFAPFELLSSVAPTGTAAIHLLVGLLQDPEEPSPQVYFDQITAFSTLSPTVYNVQWDDFPSGRTIEFSNFTWRVKGTGYYGPGPNFFSHTEESTWVDGEEQLHLTIKYLTGNWYSTEVVLEEALGYGDYIFTTRGSLDQLDVHTILGMFLYQYAVCWEAGNLWWNPHNEVDVEIGYWGDAEADIAQFVAQPWDYAGNLTRFDVDFNGQELTSYAFNWLPDRVEFRSWYGGSGDEAPENMIFTWTYDGPHIPCPEFPRVHLNLWQHNGPPSTDQEVIINEFSFIPLGGLAEPVEDLTINITESYISLTWTAVPEAVEYHIYASDGPEGPWDWVETSSSNSQLLDVSEDKKFYRVTWE